MQNSTHRSPERKFSSTAKWWSGAPTKGQVGGHHYIRYTSAGHVCMAVGSAVVRGQGCPYGQGRYVAGKTKAKAARGLSNSICRKAKLLYIPVFFLRIWPFGTRAFLKKWQTVH